MNKDFPHISNTNRAQPRKTGATIATANVTHAPLRTVLILYTLYVLLDSQDEGLLLLFSFHTHFTFNNATHNSLNRQDPEQNRTEWKGEEDIT